MGHQQEICMFSDKSLAKSIISKGKNYSINSLNGIGKTLFWIDCIWTRKSYWLQMMPHSLVQLLKGYFIHMEIWSKVNFPLLQITELGKHDKNNMKYTNTNYFIESIQCLHRVQNGHPVHGQRSMDEPNTLEFDGYQHDCYQHDVLFLS